MPRNEYTTEPIRFELQTYYNDDGVPRKSISVYVGDNEVGVYGSLKEAVEYLDLC